MSYKHICADRDANEEVDQQGYDRCIAADRRHGFHACELADHGDIRRVEELLQHARQHKRDRKKKDLVDYGAARQVRVRWYSLFQKMITHYTVILYL